MNPRNRAAAFVLATVASDAALAQDKTTPKGTGVLHRVAACDQRSTRQPTEVQALRLPYDPLARTTCLLIAAVLLATAAIAAPTAVRRDGVLPLTIFYDVAGDDEAKAQAALERLAAHWDNAYAAPLLDLLPFLPPGRVQRGIVSQLEKASMRLYGDDLNRWYEWL